MNVKLVWATPEAESVMGYCARVSNPANQENPEVEKLLGYCVKNQHWSVFEMANLCLEIQTSRAISAQILRHRSFTFQEFSQRYAMAVASETYEARRQDFKNRQNSIDDLSEEARLWFFDVQAQVWNHAHEEYIRAIGKGIAKECARFLLPSATSTTLYMNGSIRSWIHYIELRTKPGTQLEHREIALACQDIFKTVCPKTAGGLGWL